MRHIAVGFAALLLIGACGTGGYGIDRARIDAMPVDQRFAYVAGLRDQDQRNQELTLLVGKLERDLDQGDVTAAHIAVLDSLGARADVDDAYRNAEASVLKQFVSAYSRLSAEVQTEVRPRLETLMRTAIEDLESAADSVRREAGALLIFGAELIPADVSPEPVAVIVRTDSGLAADAMSVLERMLHSSDSAQVTGFAREFSSHPDERVREAARAMLRNDP